MKLQVVAIVFIVGVFTAIVSWELVRKLKEREKQRADAWGDKSQPEFIKAITGDWKTFIIKATEDYINTGTTADATAWKAQIKADNDLIPFDASEKLTLDQAVRKASEYLWDMNKLRMFDNAWKTSTTGDKWKYYWAVKWKNDNAQNADIKSPLLINELSKIQNS